MAFFNGTSGDDVFVGGPDNDTALGNGGNDQLSGGGGNDNLSGGFGDDVLDGGEGNDTIDGGQGKDMVYGGAGDDSLRVGPGGLNLAGELVDGGDGIDLLTFGANYTNTNIVFSIADPSIDQLVDGVTIRNVERVFFVAFDGNDTLTGGAYDDTFLGGFGNDIIHGGGGNDLLRGENGQDQLFGDDGDDTLYMLSDLLLDGGAGIDLAVIDFTGGGGGPGITLDVSDPSVDQMVDGATVRNIEQLSYRGGGGINHITGGAYDDLIVGGAADDILAGGGGKDTVSGGEGVDQLFGGGGDDFLHSFENAAIAGDSLMDGGDGFDLLELSIRQYSGATTIDLADSSGRVRNIEQINFYGGTGSNVVTGGGAGDTMSGNSSADEFRGLGGDDNLFGGAGNDLLYGGAGNDRIEGDAGADTIYGEDGNDSLRDTGMEASFIDGGSGNDEIIGGGGADTLIGGEGNDYIDGGAGTDTMTGGIGDDIYFVDALDSVTELAGEGTDEIRTVLASYTLGDAFENLSGNPFSDAPQSGQTLIGNAGDNIISGSSGNDTLIGRGGNDSMRGGHGNDTYYVEDAGDEVRETPSAGTDRVFASVSYVLTAGSEIESLQAIAAGDATALNLTGNARAQTISGNAGANVLTGGGGADYLVGLGGDDTLVGNADAASTMEGGTGNDWYYVSRTGDSVIEAEGQGDDRVLASVDFTLSNSQEIENLSAANAAATDAINLTGNAFAQLIYGNAGANILTSGGGADYLVGFGGDDILVGNAGAASTLQGGTGNDWYYITRTGDSLVEFAGEGNDRILTSVSYTLSAGQSIETLNALDAAATTAINLTGNALAQVINGNAGANVLTGGGGADYIVGFGGDDILVGNADAASTLQGGTGNDWYYISRTGDSLVEFTGEGIDRILTSVSYTLSAGQEIETLAAVDAAGTAAINLTGNGVGQVIQGTNGVNTLSGDGGADDLSGFGGTDILLGGDGDDLLNGGAGNDVLDGGAGADLLVFADALGAGNIDAVQNFVSGQDRLLVENAVFTGLATGTLSASAFVTGTAAQDADDRFIYNGTTGELLFDADGNGAGAAIQFASFAPATVLTASDIVVI